MATKTLLASDLAQFTGSENWYRHALNRNVTYTDGAQYVAEHGGAYWLLDEIATSQLLRVKASFPATEDTFAASYDGPISTVEFQLWTLKVDGNKGTLTLEDGDEHVLYTKDIEFTDFPLAQVQFYCINGVIHLPSEY